MIKTYLNYTPELRQRILDNCDRENSRVDEIAQLSFDLAETFSDAIHEFSKQYNINLHVPQLILRLFAGMRDP